MVDPVEDNRLDLPDYEHTEDETFPPLPPPASPGRHYDEGALANEEADGNAPSEIKDTSVTAQKTVKRPKPKLDAQRLISERGLPALRHLFDSVKFKGKGHEVEDLDTLMRRMEHWAHRLYPKLPFDDFIDKVESLGNKKEVQTCLKRIRLDLPILSEDFTSNEDGRGESNRLSMVAEDLDIFSENAKEEFDSRSSSTLTEEQQQRMERNRRLALERRQAKIQFTSLSQHDDQSAGHSDEEFNSTGTQNPDNLIKLKDTLAAEAGVAEREAMGKDTQLEPVEEEIQ
ncbi:PREDICTED: TIMELESS-interacting protein [Crocodylus porosus]|uniref:TIMELESS-interacting protein n=1 Tax=Crocodylus porosus TaxID=8502 RepID=A0A7M4DWJ7_CROPO|nr:PREDICTED: TIMELESS-interacting protein [Crocodylus porosus]